MHSSFSTLIASMVIFLPAFLLALSVHEYAHALTAYLLGDPTAKNQGRLTLNPIAHIDPMGLIFLMLFRVGWAKAVIFDARNFKKPRLYTVFTALAGPFANFLLALVGLYILKYAPLLGISNISLITLQQIMYALVYINIGLGVFNLLPIPPLDGSHILMIFLIKKYPHIIEWFYRYSIFIFIFIFLAPPIRMGFIYLIQIVKQILTILVI
ncbi:MAG: Peptidase, M50 family [candidate division TM6 bacterium GW2011_GWF2_38_10]|nr:MAG: Peptidase, M50 family [candidate division TM6 bacterium GW2011_GWF2_38_10]